MSISLLTRKRLWAKAGNRCAICKCRLVSSENKSNSDVNVGEECHIISEKHNGPRYKKGLKDYDIYNNLILLCRNDHKIVDSLPESYTEEILRFMKTNHEHKIDEITTKGFDKNKSENLPRFLKLVTSGKELINLARGAYASRVDFDQHDDDLVNESIAELIDGVIEYGEMDDFLTTKNVMEGSKYFDSLISNIRESGFEIYADKSIQLLTNSDKTEKFKWPVFTILVKKVK